MKNIFRHLFLVTIVLVLLMASASLVFADTDTEISGENSEVKMYTIDFYDIHNNLIESKTFPEGSVIVPPEMPESPENIWINTEDESDILTETSTANKNACYYLVYLKEVINEENEVIENATTFDLTPDSEKVFTYNGKDYYDTEATTTYTAGDNITAYWYESDGVLGFVGSGAMNNWSSSTPWDDIKSNITDVYLSDEITTLGESAFHNCTNLKTINALPSRLTSIGDCVFDNCNTLALTGSLPSGLTSIGISAFWGCTNLALTGELPNGLTTIERSVFQGCTNLTLTGSLPSGLTTIGDYAFRDCTNLALSGSLPSGLTSIGGSAFNGCTNLALTGELPSGLTSIGDYAFVRCINLALSGELPNGLTSISYSAFNGCTKLALTGSLPSGLTSIGSYAFYNCANLALTGSLPSGLTNIGSSTFDSCTNLALSGSLPSGLTNIGNDAFYKCTNLALTGELPRGLTSIGSGTFYGCTKLALTGELPSGLTSIGTSAFYGCSNLTLSGELPSGLTTIGEFAFFRCTNLALTGDIPSNISSIGSSAFCGVDATKTHFNKNLSSVTIIPSMYIPTSYTVTDTFADSEKADAVTTKYGFVGTSSVVGTAPTYEGYALKTDCTDAAITIGATDADRLSLTRMYEKVSTKVFTYNGKDYYDTDATTVYEAGADIKAYWYADDGVLGFVGTGDMYDWKYDALIKGYTTPWYSIKSNITDVYLSDEITSVGSYAFLDCTNLEAINAFPSGLTTIGSYAFGGCTNLALSGSLPSGLTSIGTCAFGSCTNLALTGELPSGLTSIENGAFSDCANLALTGELPSGLTFIDKYAFGGCTNLALTGELPSGLTSIGSSAFYGCTNLALTGELPSGLTAIGMYTFFDVDPEKTHFDKNLSSVTITSDIYVPTSYTVIDIFNDGKKADVVTTKYGYVEETSSAGTAPTYEGYKLKTDCADAPITIGATDADRLTLTREYKTSFTAFKFFDADDNYITTVYVPAGSEVTAPDAPEVEGKRFLRWVDEEGEALPEISTGEERGYTYHPEYTVNTSDYTVYIYDGSYGQPINKKLLKTLNFDEPTEITLENYFEDSEPFDDGMYVRGYWNWTPYGEPLNKQTYEELHIGDKLMVNGPVELIVVYTNKRIDIKYLNDDDSLIWYYRAGQTSRLIYPETPKHSKNPDIYTFDHWVDEYGNKYYPGKSELDYVSDSRTLKAVYAANKYNITFRDYDNSIFFSSDVPFGEKIEVPEPTRDGYTFTGWSPVFSGICNGKAEYTAQYKKNPIMYTIRFVDYNDNLIASNIYKEGSNIVIPISPTRDGYRFTGWSPSVNNKAVASVTYKATYEKKEEVATPTPTVPTTPSTPVTPVPTPLTPTEPTPVPKPEEEVAEPDDRISESDLPVKTPERVPETVPEKLPELNIEDVPVPKPADIKEKAPVKPVKQETKEKQPLDNIPKKSPLEEIATPIIRGVAITTLATGAIGVGLATTGGLSYWWLLLGCLLFKKKYPKILGIIPNSKRYVSHNDRPLKKKDVAMYYESWEDMADKYSLAEAIDRMNAQNCYSIIEKSLQRIEIIADDKLFTIEKSEFENLDKILCDYINFNKVEIRFVYDDAEYSVTFI